MVSKPNDPTVPLSLYSHLALSSFHIDVPNNDFIVTLVLFHDSGYIMYSSSTFFSSWLDVGARLESLAGDIYCLFIVHVECVLALGFVSLNMSQVVQDYIKPLAGLPIANK
jgi:hypothetical protein